MIGILARDPPPQALSGIAWIDEPGEDPVVARVSRGLGLPPALPDIVGLALRVKQQSGSFDILLASTGSSRLGRFLVTLHRQASKSMLGSLMPYKGSLGPILLAARTVAPLTLPARLDRLQEALTGETWRLALFWARPSGPWIRFGSLDLRLDLEEGDTAIRFDPVENPPRGAQTYQWAGNLRRRAYRLARRRPVARH